MIAPANNKNNRPNYLAKGARSIACYVLVSVTMFIDADVDIDLYILSVGFDFFSVWILIGRFWASKCVHWRKDCRQ